MWAKPADLSGFSTTDTKELVGLSTRNLRPTDVNMGAERPLCGRGRIGVASVGAESRLAQEIAVRLIPTVYHRIRVNDGRLDSPIGIFLPARGRRWKPSNFSCFTSANAHQLIALSTRNRRPTDVDNGWEGAFCGRCCVDIASVSAETNLPKEIAIGGTPTGNYGVCVIHA